MNTRFNFSIHSAKPISSRFREKGILDFVSAAEFIRHLPYRRNSSKTDPEIIFRENCGTCGTKHAVLALLAAENEIPEVKLITGIYRMNRKNTPGIGNTLEKYQLDFIPEAHNYLRIAGEILDYTGINPDGNSFADDLLDETEMFPDQVGDYKVQYHRNFLKKWISENEIGFSLEAIWKIREECINAISINLTRLKQ